MKDHTPRAELAPDLKDPRAWEYRCALADINRGLSAPRGAHERYKRSIGPYLEFRAEQYEDKPELLRRYAMLVLLQSDEFGPGLPLGAVLIAFRATKEDSDWLEGQLPTLAPEPIDEQERLHILAQTRYRQYLRTPHWQSVRKAALERADHRCQLCGDHTRQLEVHHRIYRGRTASYGAEKPTDVIVLCADCHARHHGKVRAA